MTSTPNKPPSDHRKWLQDSLPQHERLATGVRSLLENMLRKKSVEYLGVSSRVKTLEGALEKIARKDYRDPRRQLTDLSGIRVITYLEEQVSQISAIIKDLFEVDPENSLDRLEILGSDKVGYRSTHFVCALGKKRGELPEYEALGELKFEIQVRTVLQHAWAELAHDRSFKFGVALPPKIQRKLNLYSGLLEIVDGAFDEISTEIDEYRSELQTKSANQISDTGVDSLSVEKYLTDVEKKWGGAIKTKQVLPEVISELNRMGIKKIGQIEKIISDDFITKYKALVAPNYTTTGTGVLRSAMLYSDLKKYFKTKPDWGAIPQSLIDMLATKYEKATIAKIISKHRIEVERKDEPFKRIRRRRSPPGNT
jgi:putative GTP pyrophosphokinase